MDIKNIEKLVKIFDASSLTELSIEEDGTNIYLSRHKEIVTAAPQQIAMPATQMPAEHATPVQNAPDFNAAPDTPKAVDGHQICSPIVGTFFSAPSPDSEPYVAVGDKVKVGQALCIVEAMKVMNEIESDKAGTITEILIENAQAVEYSQPLFVIKPE